MEKSRIVLLAAMIVFAVSFFLPAVYMHDAVPPAMPGYTCAHFTLIYPWTKDGLNGLSKEPLQYFAFLLSGWINPVFLAAVIFLQSRRGVRPGRVLRILLLCMIPACWIVFYNDHIYPIAGYFLWTVAMLAALFAASLARIFTRDKEQGSSTGAAAH